MTDALGTWPNAPLAYVLAQVRILPGPNFDPEKIASAMHQDLFQEFPRKTRVDSQKLVIGPDSVPKLETGESILVLSALDQRQEVLISPGFVTFQATKYEDHPRFQEQLAKVVASMFKHFGPFAIQQVGLRYIDFIYPKQGDQLQQYLPAAQTTIDIPGKIAETSLHATDVQFAKARAIVRVTRGKGRASLPADLGPVFNLAPSAIMEKDPGHIDTAILDIDGIATHYGQELKDQNAVMSVFIYLHDDITGRIFKAMTTEEARQYWKKVPS